MKYLLLVICLVSCSPAYRYTLKSDNDLYQRTGTDQDFTAGHQFSAETRDTTGSHDYYGRQLIYTPTHKRLDDPIPTERPYSGYLGGGYRANYVDANVQDTYGVEFGIVGPHSYAEQTQSEFHRLIGDAVPKGWDHQLHDEPVVLLTAERRWLYDLSTRASAIPLIGVQGGNMFDQAYLGGVVRYGFNVPRNFDGSDPIFPRAPREINPGSPIRVWVFAGVLERAVAHNIFLDGNTFRDSRSVDSKPFVTEGRLGIAFQYLRYRISYTFIKQSREYRTEERGMQFGEVAIGCGF